MGFPSVFLFFTKKSHMVYMEKKKHFVPIGSKIQFLHGLYGGKIFLRFFCAILTKSKECHCWYYTLSYGLLYSTQLYCFSIEQGFACSSVE